MRLEPLVPRLIEDGRLKVDADSGHAFSPASNTPEKPLGAITAKGYLRICVTVDGKQAHGLAHRIIWCAVNGPVPDGGQIDHINGVKTDNRISNLDLVDPAENMRRAKEAGLLRPPKHSGHYAARLTQSDVAEIRRRSAAGESGASIGRAFGISASHARRIALGKRWSSGTQDRPNG